MLKKIYNSSFNFFHNSKESGGIILNLFFTLIDKGLVFISIPIFTKLLNPSEYGILQTFISASLMLSIIVGLSFHTSIRLGYYDFKNNYSSFLDSVYKSLFVINIFFVFVILLLTIIFKVDFLKLSSILVLNSVLLSIINCKSNEYLVGKNYLYKNLLSFIPNFLAIIFSVIFISFLDDERFYGRILPILFFNLIFGSIIFLKSINFNTKINFNYIKYAFNTSIPIIFHGLSITVLFVSDRIFLISMTSSFETGLYSLAYSLSLIPFAFASSVESVWIPWFNENMLKSNFKSILDKFHFFMAAISVLCILMILFGKEIISIVSSDDYLESHVYLSLLVFTTLVMIMNTFLVNLLYYYKLTKKIGFSTVVSAFLNLFLNYFFILNFGAIGAVYSSCFCFIILTLLNYRNSIKINNELFRFSDYITYFVIVLMIYLLSLNFNITILFKLVFLILTSFVLFYYSKFKHS
tara:strand:+ start:1005 stop:2402 length:1398 start_codon:yes stop_codon:yes gene_type:complete